MAVVWYRVFDDKTCNKKTLTLDTILKDPKAYLKIFTMQAEGVLDKNQVDTSKGMAHKLAKAVIWWAFVGCDPFAIRASHPGA